MARATTLLGTFTKQWCWLSWYTPHQLGGGLGVYGGFRQAADDWCIRPSWSTIWFIQRWWLNIFAISQNADDILFNRILANEHHVLKPLLPDQRSHSYSLRQGLLLKEGEWGKLPHPNVRYGPHSAVPRTRGDDAIRWCFCMSINDCDSSCQALTATDVKLRTFV